MATITFRTHFAAVVFSSMAEGMADVQRDDENHAAADLYSELSSMNGLPEGEGGTITIPDHAYNGAMAILENCLDNGPGGHIDGFAGDAAEEEGDDRDYLLEGEIEITLGEPARIVPLGPNPDAIDLRQAVRLAIVALSQSLPGTKDAEAHDWLVDLYQQQGCEHLGENESGLVENCQIFIRG